MVNITPEIIEALGATKLKVYNENFLTATTEVPCISYYEYENSSNADTTEFGISNIIYHIKIWAKAQKDLVNYSAQVDSIMRKQGFERTSSTDLWTGSIGQRNMKFKALAFEDFE